VLLGDSCHLADDGLGEARGSVGWHGGKLVRRRPPG
jgi:hypothetical protein